VFVWIHFYCTYYNARSNIQSNEFENGRRACSWTSPTELAGSAPCQLQVHESLAPLCAMETKLIIIRGFLCSYESIKCFVIILTDTLEIETILDITGYKVTRYIA
jgi:hypothetical protein